MERIMPIMKNSFTGLLLSFQFFTSLPIRRQLPINQKTVTSMYMMMPLLGVLMGCSVSLLYTLNIHFVDVSNVLLAILVVVAGIVMTGGLHLDGWIDMGDAFFSYQNKEKRLEILEDPRVGAFGAISLVVLLLLKIGFIYEFLNRDSEDVLFYFLSIPFISRLALLIYFVATHTVKEKGLAAYFKSQVNHRTIWIALILYAFLYSILTYFFIGLNGIILIGCMLLFVFLYRKWTINNFGGMTGDLVGALYEGTEVFLWGIILLFI